MLGTCSEDHRPNPVSFRQVHSKDTRCCGWAVPAQPQTTSNPAAGLWWQRMLFIPHCCCLRRGLAEQKSCLASHSERRQPVL